jgi:DNA-directed RNA polymerase sigma subunit (sigma70/sigma32)
MTLWAAEDGWPYPDALGDLVDVAGEADDDLLSVQIDRHLLDDLDGLEREVVMARFGLQGHEVRTMKQLRSDLHLPRTEIRDALGSGLEKIRMHLST